jgi:dipeptidyl aminopeptidase/acylaminoacyl peptidase
MRKLTIHYRFVTGLLLVAAGLCQAEEITRPSISEEVSPLQVVTAEARDGHKTVAVVRKPPGKGPFPALVLLHGGLRELPVEHVKAVTTSRFLAAGYVVVAPTFRDRNNDPQTRDALLDCLAVLDYVGKMESVDPGSIVLWGISGGGSLALELAGEAPLAAIAVEEPATILFAGMFNNKTPRAGAQYKVSDANDLMDNPQRYYTPELKAFTREKIARIRCPIFLAEGGRHPINRINNEILIPELLSAGKALQAVLYAGAGHGFSQGFREPEAALKFFGDASAFFLRYVARKPTPVKASLISYVPSKK